MKFLPFILRNLGRNSRRSILTALSIAVSIFVFAALMSLPTVIDEIIKHESGSLRLITLPKSGFFHQMPHAYIRKIAAVPHVVGVAGETLFLGTIKDPYNPLRSAGIDAEQAEKVWPDMISPEMAAELRRYRDGVLVGKNLLRRYRWKPGDTIILHGTVFPVDLQLRVLGALKGDVATGAMLFRRDYLDEALGRPGKVNVFWLRVDSAAAIPSVIAEIDERLGTADPVQTEAEEVLIANQISAYSIMINGAKVLALIVIVTIGMVALNTASMSIRERRSEMAVMRTLGFTRGRVIALFGAEGVATGLVGAAMGCGAAYLALHFMVHAADVLGPLATVLRLPLRVAMESMGVGLALGMTASLAPAILATRGEIATELRALG